jgi:hypothetical protein
MGLIINSTKMGKPYINSIKYNAYIGGKKIWNDVENEEFSFTVQDSGSFDIPLEGVNGGAEVWQPYNWIIDWGDGTTQTVSGTGGGYIFGYYIPHTYSDSKSTHTIIIRPNGKATQGWFNAFGCGNNPASNSAKIISINSPQITTNMRTIGPYSHYLMFSSCSGLTSLPENLLPATTLADRCYHYIFSGCTKLTSIPEKLLPATTLANYCYFGMFNSCTGLTSIPANLLPATTLANGCYSGMFMYCMGASLTSIPANLLPATTLANSCYEIMFYYCTNLTSIPNNFLPATTLVNNCYMSMFYECRKITNIGTINAAWFSARTPTQSKMFYNCNTIATPITYANIPTAWKS